MAKIGKGLASALPRFIIVGIVAPFLIEYFAPTLSAYVSLPLAAEVWAIFLLMGGLYAITNFLQTAYSKGEYPWLVGKLGGGVVVIIFFTLVFGLLPKSFGAAGVGGGIQSTGLLYLIYLDVILAYLYLFLDFADARRSRSAALRQEKVSEGGRAV